MTRCFAPKLRLSAVTLGIVTALAMQGWMASSPVDARALTAGGFTTDASVTPNSVAQSATATIDVSVTSSAATTVLVDVEVYGPTGAKVFQRAYDRQAFSAGQRRSYPVIWTVPLNEPDGAHTVQVGIFSVGWGSVHHWNNGAASFAVGTSTPPPGGAKRIMPLGDSLTDGYNIPGGYRTDLWAKFVADGLSIDFVGSLANGPASLADKHHEGHSGWRIDEISGSVATWLNVARPDIVLLMIGTNDMTQDYNVSTAPERLSALIDQITTALPQAHLVVASIPRMEWSPGLERTQAYNATIPGVVNAKVSQGKRVSYVDVFAVIAASDLHTDLTHLNASGNSKIANVWYPAIRSILGLGGPPATPTPTPTKTPVAVTATPTATATATPTSPTATATPTPSSGQATVTFDDKAGQNQALNGQYPSGVITWGTNAWYHSGPWGKLSSKSVSFNGSTVQSRAFTFVSPRRLVSLQAYNGGSSTTVSLSCAGQTTKAVTVPAGQVVTIPTGWSGTCTTVTIGSTNSWDTNFDNLVHDAGP